MTTKAIGYIRVSKAGRHRTEEEQRLSLRQQADSIRTTCETKGWDLVEIAEDFALSGADDTRPGLAAVTEAIHSGAADVVVVRHVDRLYRKAWRLLRLVDSPENGGEGWDIYAIEQNSDTSEPEGWFAFAQFALFGDFERGVIGKRTRLALAQLKREGKHVGRPSGIATEVEDRIAALYAGGLSASAIAEQLEAEGVPRPTAKSKSWHHSHVLAAVRREEVRRAAG